MPQEITQVPQVKSYETVFINNGEEIHISKFDVDEKRITSLAPGFYSVEFCKINGFYLRIMNFQEMPKRVYGDVKTRSDRILNTFISRNRNTGVLLHGMKGTGKSLLARQVCYDAVTQLSLPILVIQEGYSGNDFISFMENIQQPCIVNLDEFEKTYSNKEDPGAQDGLLSMMDGVSSQNKLWLLTVNEKNRVSEYLINRPGRIFYKFNYGVIPEETVIEVCEDNGMSKQQIDNLMSVYGMINELTFDVLMAIIEESKRYDEMPTKAIKFLNIDVENQQYINKCKAVIKVGDNIVLDTVINQFMPTQEFFELIPYCREYKNVFNALLGFNKEFENDLTQYLQENKDKKIEDFDFSQHDYSSYKIELVSISGRVRAREYIFKDLLDIGITGELKGVKKPKFTLTIIPQKFEFKNDWTYLDVL